MSVVRLLAMAGVLLLGATCAAAETVTVFGLPLGGTAPAMKLCPANTDKATGACWIGAPYKGKHGQMGSVHLPNPDGRPAWAAYAGYEVSVDRSGRLERIKVSTVVAGNRSEIADSISSRWGQPNQSDLARPGPASATWNKTGLTIFMVCSDKCTVEFRSAGEQANRDKAAEARKQIEAARPASP